MTNFRHYFDEVIFLKGAFMKVAVVGSRNLSINNMDDYIPNNVSEIISGGAKGIDTDAKKFALNNNIPYKEFLPNYARYGKSAPLKRNIEIIKYSDIVIAFWDGKSHGTRFVINNCKSLNIPIKIIHINN